MSSLYSNQVFSVVLAFLVGLFIIFTHSPRAFLVGVILSVTWLTVASLIVLIREVASYVPDFPASRLKDYDIAIKLSLARVVWYGFCLGVAYFVW